MFLYMHFLRHVHFSCIRKNAFLTSFCKDLNKEKNLKQANDFICTCDVLFPVTLRYLLFDYTDNYS